MILILGFRGFGRTSCRLLYIGVGGFREGSFRLVVLFLCLCVGFWMALRRFL